MCLGVRRTKGGMSSRLEEGILFPPCVHRYTPEVDRLRRVNTGQWMSMYSALIADKSFSHLLLWDAIVWREFPQLIFFLLFQSFLHLLFYSHVASIMPLTTWSVKSLNTTFRASFSCPFEFWITIIAFNFLGTISQVHLSHYNARSLGLLNGRTRSHTIRFGINLDSDRPCFLFCAIHLGCPYSSKNRFIFVVPLLSSSSFSSSRIWMTTSILRILMTTSIVRNEFAFKGLSCWILFVKSYRRQNN